MLRRRPAERGQGMVEFAMLVPVFLLILLGLLEFGFVFDEQMTLAYGTREGARSGAAFGAGNSTSLPCADVDKNIVAAVQRVLKGPGSRVALASSTQIQLFRATASGGIVGGCGQHLELQPGQWAGRRRQSARFQARPRRTGMPVVARPTARSAAHPIRSA